MKQGKEVGNDVVHMVGNEHLVAIELDFVLVYRHTLLDLREVEYAGEVERIVHIEVDVEHRVLLHRIEGVVEVHVVLLLQLARSLGPDRLYCVDDIVLISFHALAVLPLGLLAENHRDRHELAVLAEQLLDTALACELVGVGVQVHGNHGTAVFLHAFAHLVGRRTVAAPEYRLCAFLPAESLYGHLGADHEGGIEAEAEMSDNGLVLVFLKELAG